MRKRYIVPGLLALSVVAAGVGVTREKSQEVQRINAGIGHAGNMGYESVVLNPLVEEQDGELPDAVKEYYRTLHEDAGFVEYYDNVQVYTKRGKLPESYIVFVTYEMKIPDIYTKVPGLGTLYVTKDKDTFRIEKDGHGPEILQCVQMLSAHDDVQGLLRDVNSRYEQAVREDALLREALSDLKRAYEEPEKNG